MHQIVALRRPGSHRFAPAPRSAATLAALAAAALAALMAAAALTPAAHGPFAVLGLGPGSLGAPGHALALAASGGLLLLARGLWHGTRRAAVVASAALAAVTVSLVAEGHAGIPAAAALALALALAVARRSFPRGAARGRLRLPAAAAGAAAGATYAAAAAALLTSDRVSSLGASAVAAAGWLASGAWWLGTGSPVAIVVDVLAAATLLAAAVLLQATLRPSEAHEGHTAEEHARAAALVAAHATDSLDPFLLREDKSFHFACGGVLGYRVLRSTAVVAGDPVGPPGSAPAILRSFAELAAQRGWEVVVTAASGRHLEAYREMGFGTMCIGEEAVVDVAGFSLEGGAMKTLRKAVGRQRRRGWTVEVVPGAGLDRAVAAQIEAVDRAWRTENASLSGFAMTLGRLWGGEEDERCVYVVGQGPDGRAHAFLRFLRYPDGLSLDLMRRVGETPNGLNDAMVAAAIEHARDRGLATVSLNFAGFSHVMADVEDPSLGRRLARWALGRAHGRFQLERLARFNAKFGPRWEPRYLVHQGRVRLPHAGLRVLQAEAYVRGPRPRRLRARWEPRPGPALAAASPPRP